MGSVDLTSFDRGVEIASSQVIELKTIDANLTTPTARLIELTNIGGFDDLRMSYESENEKNDQSHI